MSFKDLRQLQHETKSKVSTLCALFDVSRSGYYDAHKAATTHVKGLARVIGVLLENWKS